MVKHWILPLLQLGSVRAVILSDQCEIAMGFELVREVLYANGAWHPPNDNMRGSAPSYGSPGDNAWGIRFDNKSF